LIQIDPYNRIPLYEQVLVKIRQLILREVLSSDERMPSVRELAQSTGVNPNTIQKAYKELERTGYLYTIQGRGSFVASPEHIHDPLRKEQIIMQLEHLLYEARYLNISQARLAALVTPFISDNEEEPHD
jgi:GntR family transcriptional regulator